MAVQCAQGANNVSSSQLHRVYCPTLLFMADIAAVLYTQDIFALLQQHI